MMLGALVVLHKKSGHLAIPKGKSWLFWKTCYREIAIGVTEPEGGPQAEIYRGADAYSFLLEVVCGLHSHILGETEVMGQFRDLLKNTPSSPTKRILEEILTDAKLVRATKLKSLGNRSYGSLLRNYFKKGSEVSIIGGGKLAAEIIPWLKYCSSVKVLCRNPDRYNKLKDQFPFVTVEELGPIKTTGLIIAAPISSHDLGKYVSTAILPSLIVDLRGESREDPLHLNTQIVALGPLLSQMESVKMKAQKQADEAKSFIKQLSQESVGKMEIRPFGWEDLCG